jgi:hypothetical protein
MRSALVVIAAAFLAASTTRGADQTVLGKQFLLKDPKPGVDATKRKFVAQGKEPASSNQIVGDPTVAGGSLTVIVTGATSANQVFVLPQGTDPSSGKPFWTAKGSDSFSYKDAKGTNGPVKSVQIKRSKSRTFQVKAVALAKNGAIDLTPPAPGSSACIRLDVGNGDRYSVVLPPPPGSSLKKDDAKTFLLKNALSVGPLCIVATPVCGNGVREPGEQCDGGPACTASCTQTIPNCCQSVGACIAAPGFSLHNDVMLYCSFQAPGSTVEAGAVCQADGSCAYLPINPIPMCCQFAGTCTQGAAASTADLWNFHNACQGGNVGTTVPTATCGTSGSCLPQ